MKRLGSLFEELAALTKDVEDNKNKKTRVRIKVFFFIVFGVND